MSRKFGPIMQNGYVVHDWRRAAEHWTDVLGVGPFFVMEHLQFAACTYRGASTAVDMTVAIAYSGTHQIELVQQHNDAPSIYRDFLLARGEGLHHVGALVDDLEVELTRLAWHDRVVQRGQTAAGQRFAYLDTTLHPGSMLELIQADAPMRLAFDYMQQTARHWSGERPIRLAK